eukprot:10325276-Karenia_brevis.AAC.1
MASKSALHGAVLILTFLAPLAAEALVALRLLSSVWAISTSAAFVAFVAAEDSAASSPAPSPG